jgi:hypothetical protein
MSVAKWSVPSSEVTLGSITSLTNGSIIIVSDIDNTGLTNTNLYVSFWVELSSFTPSTGASLTVRLVRKKGSQYESTDQTTFTGETLVKAITTGPAAKFLHIGPMRLPGGFIWGVQFVNNTGTTISTSTPIVYQTFNEDIA